MRLLRDVFLGGLVGVQVVDRQPAELRPPAVGCDEFAGRLSEGGSIRTYYPLSAEGQAEYDAWRKKPKKSKK